MTGLVPQTRRVVACHCFAISRTNWDRPICSITLTIQSIGGCGITRPSAKLNASIDQSFLASATPHVIGVTSWPTNHSRTPTLPDF